MRSIKEGFTLIELLIVIAILGIIIGSIIVILNPREAQKKARDTKRLRDLVTLQTIMDQWVTSDNISPGNWTANSGQNNESTECGIGGWLGIDVCAFTSNVPIDPVNDVTNIAGVEANATGCVSGTTTSKSAYYYVAFDATTREYEINVSQESTAHCDPNNSDGGNSSLWVEVGTDADLDLLSDN